MLLPLLSVIFIFLSAFTTAAPFPEGAGPVKPCRDYELPTINNWKRGINTFCTHYVPETGSKDIVPKDPLVMTAYLQTYKDSNWHLPFIFKVDVKNKGPGQSSETVYKFTRDICRQKFEEMLSGGRGETVVCQSGDEKNGAQDVLIKSGHNWDRPEYLHHGEVKFETRRRKGN